MNSKKYFFVTLFLLFLTQFVFAFGNREKEQEQEPSASEPAVMILFPEPTGMPAEPIVSIVQVTGRVRLVGSGPINEIVITGSEYEWFIVLRDDRAELHLLQHQTVTVEGEETIRELRFANGMPAGIRRELRYIKILEIH